MLHLLARCGTNKNLCNAVDPFHMKGHKGAFCFAHCNPESHSEIREKKLNFNIAEQQNRIYNGYAAAVR